MKYSLPEQGRKRGVSRSAIAMLEAGVSVKDIAADLGTTEAYIRNISTGIRGVDNRVRVIDARKLGMTLDAIAQKYGISVGTVQHYLRPVKKCVVREDIESGYKEYFLSYASASGSVHGMTKNKLKKLIEEDMAYYGYRFYIETDVDLMDKEVR